MSEISVDEAEKIATEFLLKKRSSAKNITIDEVTQIDAKKTRVNGTFQDPTHEPMSNFEWEVKIGANKTVYEYKIS
jgi:hypothetical protein